LTPASRRAVIKLSRSRRILVTFGDSGLCVVRPAVTLSSEGSSMEMTVAEAGAGVTCIRLNGRLDAAGADAVGLRFTAAIVPPGRNAIIDLSGVTFMASMGMRLLISTARALSFRQAQLVLFGAQVLVQDVLEQAALDQIMPITASELQALQALDGFAG